MSVGPQKSSRLPGRPQIKIGLRALSQGNRSTIVPTKSHTHPELHFQAEMKKLWSHGFKNKPPTQPPKITKEQGALMV